ncbi:MAG TPA: hypothetical protein VG795_07925, partial [Acidimicrobiia bacterium]|nr:hypothetical protein [Acidimicrobiia bacterium]
DAFPLGDWDGDGMPDTYQAGELELVPAIPLPRAQDRVEIGLATAPFAANNRAVVYLRAAGTLG